MIFAKDKDYDLKLEASVLGVCLLEPFAFGSIAPVINEESFYHSGYRIVYNAIRSVFEKGYPIDMLTIHRHICDTGTMEINGETVHYFLATLMVPVVTSAHLERWCYLLRELQVKRKVITLTSSGYKGGDPLEAATELEKELKKVLDIRATNDWMHIAQTGAQLSKHMDEVKEKQPGITTGFALIDRFNGGFRAGQLIVLGARPGMGKSAMMGRIATRAARKGSTVGIISLEMESKDILARITSAESNVDFYQIDRNEMEEENSRKNVYDVMNKLSALPIYFSDTAQVSMLDIRTKADKLKRMHGLDMLIIDYLQLIEPANDKNKNREQEVAAMSRGLKLLAMSLKIPVIILAQLNREASGKNVKPQLHHLRESGAIEQDADVVMFLHRDYLCEGGEMNRKVESTENEADLLIRKWRNGATMDIKLGFEKGKMRFYELDEEAMTLPLQ